MIALSHGGRNRAIGERSEIPRTVVVAHGRRGSPSTSSLVFVHASSTAEQQVPSSSIFTARCGETLKTGPCTFCDPLQCTNTDINKHENSYAHSLIQTCSVVALKRSIAR